MLQTVPVVSRVIGSYCIRSSTELLIHSNKYFSKTFSMLHLNKKKVNSFVHLETRSGEKKPCPKRPVFFPPKQSNLNKEGRRAVKALRKSSPPFSSHRAGPLVDETKVYVLPRNAQCCITLRNTLSLRPSMFSSGPTTDERRWKCLFPNTFFFVLRRKRTVSRMSSSSHFFLLPTNRVRAGDSLAGGPCLGWRRN